jgi:hypothetical protein
MAKELTHILIAQEVLARFLDSGEKWAAETIEKYRAAFFLGAIIPDAFFYDVAPLFDAFSGSKRISHALHSKNPEKNIERAKGLFNAAAAESAMGPLKSAFAAGIVTHTAGDHLIHNVIDNYVRQWRQTGALATATHREFETWMDMVLLEQSFGHPRNVPLTQLVTLPSTVKDPLLRFYLAHLMSNNRPVAPRLLAGLKRANRQQILFLRLFRTKRLFRAMALLNHLAGGRLRIWSSLFYPAAPTPKAFSILNRLDADMLTDGSSFEGKATDLFEKAAASAIHHIRGGVAS